MGDIADRYRRLSEAFAAKIAAVPPDRWGDRTPCPDWTVLDLVRHVVETQGMFLGLVQRSTGTLPAVEDDPLAAWNAARAAVQADLDDRDRASAEFDGFFGRTTFEAAVDRFVNFDLVIHGWDLARAAGLDETIDPDEIVRVRETSASFGDSLRSPSVVGAAVAVDDDADDQTKLLAHLGRRA